MTSVTAWAVEKMDVETEVSSLMVKIHSSFSTHIEPIKMPFLNGLVWDKEPCMY